MTRCLSALLTLLICGSAIAERESLDPCAKVAFRAELSYGGRDNRTLKDALEHPFRGYHQADSKKVLWEVVIEAYEAPNFRGWEAKINAETDLANKWALDCYKNPEKYEFLLGPIYPDE